MAKCNENINENVFSMFLTGSWYTTQLVYLVTPGDIYRPTFLKGLLFYCTIKTRRSKSTGQGAEHFPTGGG